MYEGAEVVGACWCTVYVVYERGKEDGGNVKPNAGDGEVSEGAF